jgi:predicted Fe-S protein YdhL (DUF1289 family)
MGDPVRKWVLDPDDPRAPSVEVWASMTPAERAEVLAALPGKSSNLDPALRAAEARADALMLEIEEKTRRLADAERRAEEARSQRLELQRQRLELQRPLAEALAEIERLRGK